jgi:NADPH-dependent F420 reductase
MKIGVIGTGRMGNGLGKLWAANGHQVLFGSRDPDKARRLAQAAGPTASGGTYADAVAFGDVLLFAVPWSAAQEVLTSIGPLRGKILIDITNAFGASGDLALGHTTSAAEQIAQWAPGAKVVKAFNGIPASQLDQRPYGDQAASLFFCGDDMQAKQAVAQLGAELGLDPVDCGPLPNARLLEPLAMLWIFLAFHNGMGPEVAFRLLRR